MFQWDNLSFRVKTNILSEHPDLVFKSSLILEDLKFPSYPGGSQYTVFLLFLALLTPTSHLQHTYAQKNFINATLFEE